MEEEKAQITCTLEIDKCTEICYVKKESREELGGGLIYLILKR
jgi:hypothetical protein